MSQEDWKKNRRPNFTSEEIAEFNRIHKTKYKEEYVEGVIDYFRGREFDGMRKVEEFEDQDGNIKTKKQLKAFPTPSLAGFAVHVGVSANTIKEWRKRHPEFDEACEIAMQKQMEHIIHNASTGQMPTNFAIFLLKNNHGMVDKVENEMSGNMTLESLIGQTIDKNEFKKKDEDEEPDT